MWLECGFNEAVALRRSETARHVQQLPLKHPEFSIHFMKDLNSAVFFSLIPKFHQSDT